MNDHPVDLGRIPGLHDLWARTTMRAPVDGPVVVPTRVLLDILGVGLEQTLRHLASERPDFPAFVAWILATAGKPDPDLVARYAAWHASAPAPAAEVARQAGIMAESAIFTSAEMAAWERDGVIILRQALAPEQAAEIATHLWKLLGAAPDDPDSWYGPRTNGIMIQCFQHPSLHAARRSRRMARGFAQLYGHADLIVSTDRLSFNPPEHGNYRFPGPHLHWDGSLVPPIPFETQAILYLTDTAADQGALQVVPGFHHRLAAGWIESLEGGDPRAVDLSAGAVTIAARAGDLIIWRQEIPHGASPNRADRPRLAHYITHYPMHWPDRRRWM
jgi:hypothetical protein